MGDSILALLPKVQESLVNHIREQREGKGQGLQEVMSEFRSEDKQELVMLCIFQLPIVHSSLLCVLKGSLLWMNYQGLLVF